MKSHLRRYTSLGDIHAQQQADVIRNGRLCYRMEERTLYADGEPVKLTATETKIVVSSLLALKTIMGRFFRSRIFITADRPSSFGIITSIIMEPVKLTATETKIVDLLMRNRGRIFPAEEIYQRVWAQPQAQGPPCRHRLSAPGSPSQAQMGRRVR